MLFCDIAFFSTYPSVSYYYKHFDYSSKTKKVQTDEETFGSIWIHVKATLSDSEFESSLVFKKF